MKVILVCLAMLGAGAVSAQNESFPAFPRLPGKYRTESAKPFVPGNGTTLLQGTLGLKPGRKELTPGNWPKADGVQYRVLKQDNMPCVVPPDENDHMSTSTTSLLLNPKPVNPIPNPAPPVEFR